MLYKELKLTGKCTDISNKERNMSRMSKKGAPKGPCLRA